MSEKDFQSDNQSIIDSQGRRLIKVKRMKPKTNVVVEPSQPTQVQQPESMSLTAISNQDIDFADAFEDQQSYENMNEGMQNFDDDDYEPRSGFSLLLYEQPAKLLVLVSIIFFIFGFGIAKLISSSSTQTVREGLQGVVVNPEVPKGRARCGLVDRTQGCVMYIMNPQRQEVNARDFYDLAAQLTGRQRFVIDTSNMRYSNTKIRPGAIAQINIPPLQ